jgi:cytochrome P450
MHRQCPFHPPEEYKQFQRQPGGTKVTLWDGSTAWLFTRYEDVRAVLSDNRFSGNPTLPGFPSLSASRDAVLEAEPAFIRMDPPEHTRHRRMLTKEFMIKRITEQRVRVQQIFDELLDELIRKGPPSDLVKDLFLPLTSKVIADMLDVPYEDHEFFQEQSSLRVQLDVEPNVPKEASRKILDYLDRLITAREKNPEEKNDLLSRLIVEQVQPGHLTHRELVVMTDLLLMAGHETTANQMALGVYSLLTNPDQLKLLRENPDLTKNAVEEMLRFHSIVQFNAFRVALEDVDVNGQLVRKGEGVMAQINAANRDPAAFENPDAFDITQKADHHVAFSFGVHQCLGQPLARAELQTVFSTIFERLPNLRLAVPAEEIVAKEDHFVFGLDALPVTW